VASEAEVRAILHSTVSACPRGPHACIQLPPSPQKRTSQAMERITDGGEDQGAVEALWGTRRRRVITSVLERAVSRERLFLSVSSFPSRVRAKRAAGGTRELT